MDDLEVVAHAAGLLTDSLRLRLLAELEDGALTVSELSSRLQVQQPRISAQLAILRKAGWVVAEAQGRQHYYRLTTAHINVAILELAALPAPATDQQDTEVAVAEEIAPELRTARRCYDHLAGATGVALYQHFIAHGWLEETEGVGKYQPAFALTRAGVEALAARGLALPPEGGRRRFAYACPDWTEAQPHLGGALAASLFEHLLKLGLVQRRPGTRAVAISADLAAWLAG